MIKGYIRSFAKVPVVDNWREDIKFASHPQDAWYWPTFQDAVVNCISLNRCGVEIPSSEGGVYLLRDFQVEETAPDQFSIYCEGPFIMQ